MKVCVRIDNSEYLDCSLNTQTPLVFPPEELPIPFKGIIHDCFGIFNVLKNFSEMKDISEAVSKRTVASTGCLWGWTTKTLPVASSAEGRVNSRDSSIMGAVSTALSKFLVEVENSYSVVTVSIRLLNALDNVRSVVDDDLLSFSGLKDRQLSYSHF